MHYFLVILITLSTLFAEPRVYLAGPDVFYPNPEMQAEKKKEICKRYGLQGVFPMDEEVKNWDHLTPEMRAQQIFENNVKLMESCDIIIANMSPFRGPSMDVGTAFEMGYMASLRKIVVAYSDDHRPFAKRTIEFLKKDGHSLYLDNQNRLRDNNDLEIEDFEGLEDNLMLPGAVKLGGSQIQPNFEAAVQEAIRLTR